VTGTLPIDQLFHKCVFVLELENNIKKYYPCQGYVKGFTWIVVLLLLTKQRSTAAAK